MASTESTTKYAVYYPEAGGLLFCYVLGSGRDGIVSLVQQVATGIYLVRKTTSLKGIEKVEDHPEVKNYRNHPFIPKLITSNTENSLPIPTFIIVSEYCTGGNLFQFSYHGWHSKGLYYPEILIWRMLKHIVSALIRLHCAEPSVTHNDIHNGNIFLDWSRAGCEAPDFYLGDLGRTENTNDFGAPSIYYKANPKKQLSTVLGKRIANDYGSLADLARSLMVNPPSTANKETKHEAKKLKMSVPAEKAFNTIYSLDLHNVLQSMGFGDRKSQIPNRIYLPNWGSYEKFKVFLKARIDVNLARHEAEKVPPQWSKPANALGVVLFNSEAELLDAFKKTQCPPGTWRIARLSLSGNETRGIEISKDVFTGSHGQLCQIIE